MGQTVAQKIIARAAGLQSVEAGDYVTVTPDYTCGQEIAWPLRRRYMDDVGVDRVARPDRVILVVDHTTSASRGSSYHLTHREMASYAARNGVDNFFGEWRVSSKKAKRLKSTFGMECCAILVQAAV